MRKRDAEDRLIFAVRFAQMDLNRLHPKDWVNLRDDLEAFLGSRAMNEALKETAAAREAGGGDTSGSAMVRKVLEGLHSRTASDGVIEGIIGFPWPPLDYSIGTFPKTVDFLQQEALQLLISVVDGREMMEEKREELKPLTAKVEVGCQLLPAPSPFTGRNTLLVLGPTRDVFLLILHFLLARESTDRLKRCPECSSIFLQIRRQRYCSLACTQKAHPSTGRMRKSRKRKAKWERARKDLSLLLTDIDAMTRGQSLQQPRSEQQVLEEVQKAYEKAQAAFAAAYLRQKGPGYPEGKALLARAKEQIRLAPWKIARRDLNDVLEHMRTLYRTTERQALEKAEKALSKAQSALSASFPSKTGQGYKEGKAFLASAEKQVLKLRKRVRGY